MKPQLDFRNGKEPAILAGKKISFSMGIFLMNEESLLQFKLAFTRRTIMRFIFFSHFLFNRVFYPLAVLESFVSQQSSLQTVDVVTEITVILGLSLLQIIPPSEMSLQQLVGGGPVFTVRAFPHFKFTLGYFLVANPEVLVQEGAGNGGKVTLRTFEILIVTFHKFDLRCLVRMPPSRMYLDIFLVRADILAQFAGVFQTFVNPLVMAGQLLLRSRPKVTFVAGNTLSLVHILPV